MHLAKGFCKADSHRERLALHLFPSKRFLSTSAGLLPSPCPQWRGVGNSLCKRSCRMGFLGPGVSTHLLRAYLTGSTLKFGGKPKMIHSKVTPLVVNWTQSCWQLLLLKNDDVLAPGLPIATTTMTIANPPMVLVKCSRALRTLYAFAHLMRSAL